MPTTDLSPSCAVCHGALEMSSGGFGFLHEDDARDTHDLVLMECHMCLEPLRWVIPSINEGIDAPATWKHLRHDLDEQHLAVPIRATRLAPTPPDPRPEETFFERRPEPAEESAEESVELKPVPKRRANTRVRQWMRLWVDSRRRRQLLVYAAVLLVLVTWEAFDGGLVHALLVLAGCTAIACVVLALLYWADKAPKP